MFTATVEGEAELISAWGSACNLLRAATSRGVMMGVKEGVAEAKAKHTFKNQTGDLEKSITYQVLGWRDGGNRFEAKILAGEGLKYGWFVEHGTKAHIIERRKADWLHWEPEPGDHHFAKRVRHPGTKPMPFMHFAYFKCERVIIRELELGIQAASLALSRAA